MIKSEHGLFVCAAVTLWLAASLVPARAEDASIFVSGEVKKVAVAPVPTLEAASRDLDAAWSRLPLRMTRAMFVTQTAAVYGAYAPRANAVFKPTDRILAYIEPSGYSFAPAGDGFVTFGVALDFDLIQPDGTVVAGKKDFLTWSATSRAHMKELMLNASIHFDDIPDGEYVLRFTLRDVNTGKATETDMPFTIVKGASAANGVSDTL